jgi:hypothetical protein
MLPLIGSFVMLWGYNEGRKWWLRKQPRRSTSALKRLLYW